MLFAVFKKSIIGKNLKILVQDFDTQTIVFNI